MIRLTREVRFSVDRDWAGRIEFSRPISNSWGGWPSAVGLVPYLTLRATVEGAPDPRTGYLVNIAWIDDLLRRRAIPFAAEELAIHGWRQSAERLLLAIWKAVAPFITPAPARLTRLELAATPRLRYAIELEEPDMVSLTQQFEFSAAHRLHCPDLTDAENRALFGKCNNRNGHGHNYVVEVTVTGDPAATHGVVTPLPQFEALVKERVIDALDHKHLNEDTTHFRDVNPSVENIARAIWSMLVGEVAPARLTAVRVYETPKTWAEYRGA